ncbi:lipocalin family protein [Hymenobacter sp. B1770]|uniref:lipocalin family protein n=1 Tax=Hymenobacter sp. B1770 TaxID=1718788 RepID=UPI003CEE71FD
MPAYRLRFLLLLLSAGLAFSSCKKHEELPPLGHTVDAQHLTNGSWRLDQISKDGIVTSSGSNISDRYIFKFNTDGTFSYRYTANSIYFIAGYWTLKNNDTIINLTDRKFTDIDYKLFNLTSAELRYSFADPNNNGKVEEQTFSAQP